MTMNQEKRTEEYVRETGYKYEPGKQDRSMSQETRTEV